MHTPLRIPNMRTLNSGSLSSEVALPRPTALVIGDEVSVLQNLEHKLTRTGISVAKCTEGTISAARNELPIDVIVVAASSDEIALRICEAMEGPLPCAVIIRAQVCRGDGRQLALAAGADAYAEEDDIPNMVLTISAFSRRMSRFAPDTAARKQFEFEGWRLDRENRELISPGGASTAVSIRSLRLLDALFRDPHRVIPRNELAAAAGIQREADGSPASLGVYIHRLRRLMTSLDEACDLIVNSRGRGYSLTNLRGPFTEAATWRSDAAVGQSAQS